MEVPSDSASPYDPLREETAATDLQKSYNYKELNPLSSASLPTQGKTLTLNGEPGEEKEENVDSFNGGNNANTADKNTALFIPTTVTLLNKATGVRDIIGVNEANSLNNHLFNQPTASSTVTTTFCDRFDDDDHDEKKGQSRQTNEGEPGQPSSAFNKARITLEDNDNDLSLSTDITSIFNLNTAITETNGIIKRHLALTSKDSIDDLLSESGSSGSAGCSFHGGSDNTSCHGSRSRSAGNVISEGNDSLSSRGDSTRLLRSTTTALTREKKNSEIVNEDDGEIKVINPSERFKSNSNVVNQSSLPFPLPSSRTSTIVSLLQWVKTSTLSSPSSTEAGFSDGGKKPAFFLESTIISRQTPSVSVTSPIFKSNSAGGKPDAVSDKTDKNNNSILKGEDKEVDSLKEAQGGDNIKKNATVVDRSIGTVSELDALVGGNLPGEEVNSDVLNKIKNKNIDYSLPEMQRLIVRLQRELAARVRQRRQRRQYQYQQYQQQHLSSIQRGPVVPGRDLLLHQGCQNFTRGEIPCLKRGGAPEGVELKGGLLSLVSSLERDGAVSPSNEETVLERTFDVLRHTFLPEGFPTSVTPDYLPVRVYDILQSLSSSITGTLATRAVLIGVGMNSENASAAASTIAWMARDCVGLIGRIVFAAVLATDLDNEAKQWRLVADVVNDLAIMVEVFAVPLGRSFIVLSWMAAALLRALCMVAGGSTRVSLTQHFSLQLNTADVSAKNGSQDTATGLFGVLLGMLTAWLIPTTSDGDSRGSGGALAMVITTAAFVIFTSLHLLFNYLCVKAMRLTRFNQYRGTAAVIHYLNLCKNLPRNRGRVKEISVLSPEMANDLEPVILLVGNKLKRIKNRLLNNPNVGKNHGLISDEMEDQIERLAKLKMNFGVSINALANSMPSLGESDEYYQEREDFFENKGNADKVNTNDGQNKIGSIAERNGNEERVDGDDFNNSNQKKGQRQSVLAENYAICEAILKALSGSSGNKDASKKNAGDDDNTRIVRFVCVIDFNPDVTNGSRKMRFLTSFLSDQKKNLSKKLSKNISFNNILYLISKVNKFFPNIIKNSQKLNKEEEEKKVDQEGLLRDKGNENYSKKTIFSSSSPLPAFSVILSDKATQQDIFQAYYTVLEYLTDNVDEADNNGVKGDSDDKIKEDKGANNDEDEVNYLKPEYKVLAKTRRYVVLTSYYCPSSPLSHFSPISTPSENRRQQHQPMFLSPTEAANTNVGNTINDKSRFRRFIDLAEAAGWNFDKVQFRVGEWRACVKE